MILQAETEQQAAAIEELARHLHWKMENLDPSLHAKWDACDAAEKDYCRHCVRYLFVYPALIRAALGDHEKAG